MMEEPNSEKKIIIDEDWKTQVEAERAREKESPAETPEPKPAGKAKSAQLPPPSLTFLASTLYFQAMVGMGVLPNPMGDKVKLDLDSAKHAIDLLEILFEKTAGNRTEEETQVIDGMLHELRMAFLSLRQ